MRGVKDWLYDRFYDSWGCLTGFGYTILIIVAIALFAVFADKYSAWTCSNYSKVTGLNVKYVRFDACYIENSDGEWIRYDSKYKR